MLRTMMIALFANCIGRHAGPGRGFSSRWLRRWWWRFPPAVAAGLAAAFFHGGGFRGGGMGMGGAGFRAAGIGGGGFRAAGIGGGGFRAAALPAAGFRGGTLAVNRFHGGFHRGFLHHRRFPVAVTAVGLGLRYGYYNDYYDYGDPYYGGDDDSYYDGDSGCYIVRRSVLTPYGWRIRPVQVCG